MSDDIKIDQELKITKNFGYVLGVLYGDGFISDSSIGLNVKDRDFALNFKNVFEKEFGKLGKLHIYNGLWRAIFHSKKLVKFFKTLSYDIIKESSNEVKCAFLLGMFDSEGSAYFRKDYGITDRKLELCNTNFDLLLFCWNLLRELGIEPRKINKRVRKERIFKERVLPLTVFYRFTLKENKENFVKFRELIGFSIKRKQDKLNIIINSYLETKSKWGNLREEVLQKRKLETYSEIRKEFYHIPKGTIDRWLYTDQSRVLEVNHN